ncbi:MAG TPA: hypothetical protein VJ831_03650 [Jatrophihabitantaceae bacterium]|nr:hypothetical protein [Jatrophihabitantaceae bacterium]
MHPNEPAEDPAAAVTAKLDALADLDGRPLAEHAEIYQQLHAELQQSLAEIEQTESRPASTD